MKIPFLDIKAQYEQIKDEIWAELHKVADACAFAGGPFVAEFEKNFATAHGAKHCIGMSSGTDVLHATMLALGIGHGYEVIVPTNTFIATAEGVSLAGATPVFVDCEPDFYNIDVAQAEKVITKNTRAIIAVHLYGQSADMSALEELCKKHGIYLVEDCAQAHLAEYRGKKVGNFGIAGCFSFYPGKNLGAWGEAGAVLTNDDDLAEKLRMIKDHGCKEKYHHEIIGHNYRMEGIQGAVLNIKLKHLQKWTEGRRQIANWYGEHLAEISDIILPKENPNCKHVYHLYVVRAKKRDDLMQYLAENEIYCGIHYPIPCHKQKCYESLKNNQACKVAEEFAPQLVSLPMFAELTLEHVKFLQKALEEYRAL